MSHGADHRDGAAQAGAVIREWWLTEPDVARLLAALEARGARARFVGGCVRNALMGGGDTDLDIAIDRPPEETRVLLEAAGFPAHPTGVDHGTYTTVVETREGPTPIEITSLRRDVETDGRRAVVAFTQDWSEDAERRDFTINALYCDAAGRVHDPLGTGLPDVRARRLHFIGDAETRIREDALRILRFFRFAARYASNGGGLDELRAALDAGDIAAVTRLVGLVDLLARERIGAELKKLFAAPAPAAAVALAIETGALPHALGPQLPAPLPPGDAYDALTRLAASESALGLAPAPLRRLSLVVPGLDPAAAEDALRLSRAETAALRRNAAAASLALEEAAYRQGADAALDTRLIAAARGETGAATPDAALVARIERAAAQTFPIGARDLMDRGLAPGPALGAALRRLEGRWIESGFALDRAALLDDAPDGS